MLNDEERKKLAFLGHLVGEEGKEASKEEVLWLIDRLKKTAFMSPPNEFEFPEYAALIYTPKHEAYALRRFRNPGWERDLELKENGLAEGVDVFEVSADCDQFSAFLVVRPWVRVHLGVADADLDHLKKSTIRVSFDDVYVLHETYLEDYLILRDGSSLKAYPQPIHITRDISKYAFPAVCLDGDMKADPMKPLGVFAPRDTMVRIRLEGKTGRKNGPMKVTTGLCVMEYTTKADGGGAELSIPRDFTTIKG